MYLFNFPETPAWKISESSTITHDCVSSVISDDDDVPSSSCTADFSGCSKIKARFAS